MSFSCSFHELGSEQLVPSPVTADRLPLFYMDKAQYPIITHIKSINIIHIYCALIITLFDMISYSSSTGIFNPQGRHLSFIYR